MGFSTNEREVGTDPKDTGQIHLFDLDDVLEMLEISNLRKFWGLCRRAKVRPAEGKGRAALWSAKEINVLSAARKLLPDYRPVKVKSSGPLYGLEKYGRVKSSQ